MSRFLDGPAEGKSLILRRAPLYLRVVRDAAGKWDALDQLADTPHPAEAVFAYEKVADEGSGFIDWRDKKTGRRCGSAFQAGVYRVCPEQPGDTTIRDNRAWAEWCAARHKAAQAAAAEAKAEGAGPP